MRRVTGSVKLQGALNLTIKIPDDRAARFWKVAQGRGMTVDRWILEIAEHEAQAADVDVTTPKPTLAEVFAKVRGLENDVDFSHDPSPGRDVNL
jgi:hypothetical protein